MGVNISLYLSKDDLKQLDEIVAQERVSDTRRFDNRSQFLTYSIAVFSGNDKTSDIVQGLQEIKEILSGLSSGQLTINQDTQDRLEEQLDWVNKLVG